MSEPTLAAVEAIAVPLLKDAAQALTPEAEKVLADLKAFATAEADKLRTELPQLAEQAAQHVHGIGASLLTRYQSFMDRIDAHLTGAVSADPTPAVPTPQTTQS